MSKGRARKRIHVIDELRGFSLLLMVVYHAFYLIGYQFDVTFCKVAYGFFSPARPFFSALFIFLCGLSCNLSHSNAKRGLLLAAVSALLSLVMWCAAWWRVIAPEGVIWFGVLHMLAVSILVYTLLRPTLRYIPPVIGLLLSAVLFALCYHIPEDMGGYFGIRGLFVAAIPAAATDHPLLYALGLCPISPCGDYFPLLPWFFCFLAGSFAGRFRTPKWAYRSRFPYFGAMGRHSLVIYLAHQPVLFLLAEVVFWFIRRFF